MDKKSLKNIEFSKIIKMESLVQYEQGSVISKTLSQGRSLSITLFAFDMGEEISSHSSDGDALVYILDGEAQITIGDEKHNLKNGDAIVMPAGIPHALYASQRFKMLLIVVFNND